MSLPTINSKIKQDILSIYNAALAAVEGRQAVNAYMQTLEVNEPITAIAIGKAADAMLQGLFTSGIKVKDALLISKHGHISSASYDNPAIQCIEADHPVPSTASLMAGKALVDYIAALPATATCIILISGGTSSLVEVLNDGWELEDLQELTQWMLANAFSIDKMNAVRSQVSRIKGGGLCNYFNKQKLFCLLISDVPTDDKRIIGGGLLFPLSSAIIASNKQAQQAAVKKAHELGYKIACDYSILEGDAVTIAKQCVQTLRENRGILHIWGAETTVNLPASAGKGGRNQHLALAAAIEIENNTVLLAAATDGSDGTTEDAGGLVDEQTVLRGKGLNAFTCLKQANANAFLDASGDLITTGITGTNVMDLIIGYH